MTRNLIRICFHLLPALALISHKQGIVLAALLLILTPYIKVKKLEAQLQDALESGQSLRAEELKKLIERWRYLSFMT
jgi:hypothetical protein